MAGIYWFVLSNHEQELKELAALAYRDTTAENREYWKNEMGQALREIHQVYDEKLDSMRGELETFYNLKVIFTTIDQHLISSIQRMTVKSIIVRCRVRNQIAPEMRRSRNGLRALDAYAALQIYIVLFISVDHILNSFP